ncbi:MAG: DUF4198 domain-containing protein [Candidatus Micrarchaeota archaeon]|nr:DUF4198 domain-containing protein [Candidatus Micrarchaeota archaeon]
MFLAACSIVAAAQYQADYLVSGWAKIKREIITSDQGACANMPGACPKEMQGGGGWTGVTLTVENAGSAEQKEVKLTESLAQLPFGARLSFSAKPSMVTGRLATWELGTLARGEKRKIAYYFSAQLQKGNVELIPPPTVESVPAKLLLSAPASANVGDKVKLSVRTFAGEPAPNAPVKVYSPAGFEKEVKSDERGLASFEAEEDGFYTYVVDGYEIGAPVSTEFLPLKKEEPLVAAAVPTSPDIVSEIFGFAPTLLAALAALALMAFAYNLIFSRAQAGWEGQAGSMEGRGGALVYTQTYSFAPSQAEAQEEDHLSRITKELVEKRRQKMLRKGIESAEPAKNQIDFGLKEREIGGFKGWGESEEEELEDEVEEAKKTGRMKVEEEEGELEEEKELERALAELEKIRARLKKKGKPQVASSEEEAEE